MTEPYLSRDWTTSRTAFAVRTGDMPSASLQRRDDCIHALRCSRRLIGLKLFTAPAHLGVDGYAQALRRQFRLTCEPCHVLQARGWRVLNDSALPLARLSPAVDAGEQNDMAMLIATVGVESGVAWMSALDLHGRRVSRACITSHGIAREDAEVLLDALGRVRRHATPASSS